MKTLSQRLALSVMAVVLCWSAQAGEFAVSPACWKAPRLYHAGAPPQDYSNRLQLSVLSADKLLRIGVAQLSPNGGYRLFNMPPDTSHTPPWGHDIVVELEPGRRHQLRLSDVAGPATVRWISEKLVFVRVMWGRITFQDVIWDVEGNELIYSELVRDGSLAFQQFQAACGGPCPCANGDVAEMPRSRPAQNETLGLAVLPGIFGPGETGGPIPSENPAPVTLHAAPDLHSPVVARPSRPEHFRRLEYGDEAEAAVVVGKENDWVRVLLDGQTATGGWVQLISPRQYLSLEKLLSGSPAYLNAAWDGRVYPTANSASGATVSPFYDAAANRREYPVAITQVVENDAGTWLQLAFYLNDPCEGGGQTLSDRVWVPAYNAQGRLSAWFWSRGC